MEKRRGAGAPRPRGAAAVAAAADLAVLAETNFFALPLDFPSDSESLSLPKSASPSTSWTELSCRKPWV